MRARCGCGDRAAGVVIRAGVSVVMCLKCYRDACLSAAGIRAGAAS